MNVVLKHPPLFLMQRPLARCQPNCGCHQRHHFACLTQWPARRRVRWHHGGGMSPRPCSHLRDQKLRLVDILHSYPSCHGHQLQPDRAAPQGHFSRQYEERQAADRHPTAPVRASLRTLLACIAAAVSCGCGGRYLPAAVARRLAPTSSPHRAWPALPCNHPPPLPAAHQPRL